MRKMAILLLCCFGLSGETLREFLAREGVSKPNTKFVLKSYANAETENEFWRLVRMKKSLGNSQGTRIYYFCFHPELLSGDDVGLSAAYLDKMYADWAMRSLGMNPTGAPRPRIAQPPLDNYAPLDTIQQAADFQRQLDTIGRQQRQIENQQRQLEYA